jgi:hypothetical protein
MYGFMSLEAIKRCIAYLKEFNFVVEYHARTITKQLIDALTWRTHLQRSLALTVSKPTILVNYFSKLVSNRLSKFLLYLIKIIILKIFHSNKNQTKYCKSPKFPFIYESQIALPFTQQVSFPCRSIMASAIVIFFLINEGNMWCLAPGEPAPNLQERCESSGLQPLGSRCVILFIKHYAFGFV